MDKLREYLNGLTKEQRASFVAACGTSEGYLRKAISVGQQLGADLCIALDRESSGAVPCESLRPDVDWAYLRSTSDQANQLPYTTPNGAKAREAKAPIGRQPIDPKKDLT